MKLILFTSESCIPCQEQKKSLAKWSMSRPSVEVEVVDATSARGQLLAEGALAQTLPTIAAFCDLRCIYSEGGLHTVAQLESFWEMAVSWS